MTIVRLLLLGMSLVLALTGCGPKETYPVLVPISFLLPVTITPSARTMQRGDTLWLEANFSDSLLDRNSGRRFRVRPQDLAFTSYINYHQLMGLGQPPTGVAPTFRVVEKIGRAPIGGTSSGLLQPVYAAGRYQAKIGLIPLTPGVMSLGLLVTFGNSAQALGNALPFIQLPADAQGREQKAVLNQSFYVINKGQATNFDLFRQNTKAFSLEPNNHLEQIIYEQQSTFTVEVK